MCGRAGGEGIHKQCGELEIVGFKCFYGTF
jgi:hypothetical protein